MRLPTWGTHVVSKFGGACTHRALDFVIETSAGVCVGVCVCMCVGVCVCVCVGFQMSLENCIYMYVGVANSAEPWERKLYMDMFTRVSL